MCGGVKISFFNIKHIYRYIQYICSIKLVCRSSNWGKMSKRLLKGTIMKKKKKVGELYHKLEYK